MAVKLINEHESYEAASRSPVLLLACLPAEEEEVKSPAFTCFQQHFGVFRNQIRSNFQTDLLECTFELGSPRLKPSCRCSCAAFLQICGHLLSNNFNVGLILKRSKAFRQLAVG